MADAPLRSDAVIDYEDEQVAVIRHDARALPLEDGTVDLIITSPPYFALRSYRDGCEVCGGVGNRPASHAKKECADCGHTVNRKKCDRCGGRMEWRADSLQPCDACSGTGSGHFDGQIGSEETPDQFLAALDECMVEWGRVLKPSGSVWVNLGDKYAGTGGANSNTGLGLVDGAEESFDNRGSARNNTRQTNQYRAKSLLGLPWRFAIRQIDAGWILRAEVVWSKPNGLPESVTDRVRRSHEQWFHFVKEPRYFSGVDEIREPHLDTSWIGRARGNSRGNSDRNDAGLRATSADPLGRLPGSVWTIPSEPLLIPDETRDLLDLPDHFAAFPQEFPRRIIQGWSPVGGIVLDPFGGTGTVAGVARTLGRFGISNDLSESYNRLAVWRITQSGHFTKSEQRTWADRQGSML